MQILVVLYAYDLNIWTETILIITYYKETVYVPPAWYFACSVNFFNIYYQKTH